MGSKKSVPCSTFDERGAWTAAKLFFHLPRPEGRANACRYAPNPAKPLLMIAVVAGMLGPAPMLPELRAEDAGRYAELLRTIVAGSA